MKSVFFVIFVVLLVSTLYGAVPFQQRTRLEISRADVLRARTLLTKQPHFDDYIQASKKIVQFLPQASEIDRSAYEKVAQSYTVSLLKRVRVLQQAEIVYKTIKQLRQQGLVSREIRNVVGHLYNATVAMRCGDNHIHAILCSDDAQEVADRYQRMSNRSKQYRQSMHQADIELAVVRNEYPLIYQEGKKLFQRLEEYRSGVDFAYGVKAKQKALGYERLQVQVACRLNRELRDKVEQDFGADVMQEDKYTEFDRVARRRLSIESDLSDEQVAQLSDDQVFVRLCSLHFDKTNKLLSL